MRHPFPHGRFLEPVSQDLDILDVPAGSSLSR